MISADPTIGEKMWALAARLYPICRSITGDGVRQTLNIIQEYLPIQIREVPSGTEVLDWTVPKEWNIREAWIKDPEGRKVVDFADHNLHILNYSIPVHRKMRLDELKQHIFSLPGQPDRIPYRTSYYREQWGFCLPHRQLQGLEEGTYEVYIDSSLEDGHLSYGELLLPGSEEEVLLSAHICHPALANDNLSGIAVLTFLAEHLMTLNHRYSYRFIFIPGTIGAISWLALNRNICPHIRHGLVASLLGDSSPFTYKKSRKGDAEIDRVVAQVLRDSGHPHQVIDFFPYGYDERQFCSPGFNLPVGNLTRAQFGQFSEYHTSGDDLDFIKAEYLAESLGIYRKVTEALEQNRRYLNLFPYGEPQLGKRGLYEAIGGNSDQKQLQMAMLWVLNYSDGQHSLLDIAERSGYSMALLARISCLLQQHQLIKPCEDL